MTAWCSSPARSKPTRHATSEHSRRSKGAVKRPKDETLAEKLPRPVTSPSRFRSEGSGADSDGSNAIDLHAEGVWPHETNGQGAGIVPRGK